jgi:glc operon protein GlcG
MTVDTLLVHRPRLTIAAAKAIAAAAEAAAAAQDVRLVIAIVDEGGHLMLLHRDDDAQVGSVEIATLKARTAVLFRRETKAFQDVVEGEGRLALLCIPNGIPLDGGVLLKSGDVIIGAIGVSGASDELDGDIGRIGAALLG